MRMSADFGVVRMNEDSRITDFEGKTAGGTIQYDFHRSVYYPEKTADRNSRKKSAEEKPV